MKLSTSSLSLFHHIELTGLNQGFELRSFTTDVRLSKMLAAR